MMRKVTADELIKDKEQVGRVTWRKEGNWGNKACGNGDKPSYCLSESVEQGE